MKPSKKRTKSVLYQVFAIGVGVVVILPIIYALLISFMKPSQILTIPPQFFPKEITFENYKKALGQTQLGRYMINSLIIAGVSSIARIVTGSMAAFAFSFFEFRGKKLLFICFLGTVMIPSEVVLVTNYRTISAMGLINTYMGMMAIFMVSALNIFLMRQYFLTFSKSLKEAASVDGCGNFRFFTRILLPSSVPVMTTVFISAFIGTWNTYLWPLIVTNNNSMRTVQVGITMLNFPEGSVHGPIMAATIVVLIPSIIVFMLFQRKIMGGMMSGAVKG